MNIPLASSADLQSIAESKAHPLRHASWDELFSRWKENTKLRYFDRNTGGMQSVPIAHDEIHFQPRPN